MNKKYRNAYYKSEHWKRLKEQVLKRDNHTCQHCGKKLQLEVHHLEYKKMFNCSVDDCVTLCHRCHTEYHKLLEGGEQI